MPMRGAKFVSASTGHICKHETLLTGHCAAPLLSLCGGRRRNLNCKRICRTQVLHWGTGRFRDRCRKCKKVAGNTQPLPLRPRVFQFFRLPRQWGFGRAQPPHRPYWIACLVHRRLVCCARLLRRLRHTLVRIHAVQPVVQHRQTPRDCVRFCAGIMAAQIGGWTFRWKMLPRICATMQ